MQKEKTVEQIRQFDVFVNPDHACWTIVISTNPYRRGLFAIDCRRPLREGIDNLRVGDMELFPLYQTMRHVPFRHLKKWEYIGTLDDISAGLVIARLNDAFGPIEGEKATPKLRRSNIFSWGSLSYVCQHSILTTKELAKGLGCSEGTIYNIRRHLEVCGNDILRTLRYYYGDKPINLVGIMSKTHLADVLGEMLTSTTPASINLGQEKPKDLKAAYMFLYIYGQFGSLVAARVFGMNEDEVKYTYRILKQKYYIG